MYQNKGSQGSPRAGHLTKNLPGWPAFDEKYCSGGWDLTNFENLSHGCPGWGELTGTLQHRFSNELGGGT